MDMPYFTDLSEEKYALIQDIFDTGNYGKNREHSVLSLINAVFYLNKTGCQWRLLPNDFPKYTAVESFYRRARKSGKWDEMLQRLVTLNRVQKGKDPEPTYALIDSQSVATTSASEQRGIDGGKKSQRA